MVELYLDELEDNMINQYSNNSRIITEQTEQLSLDFLGVQNNHRYFEYVGPLDQKTRDICIYALSKQYFTNDERWDFEQTHGIRYNCRHHFSSVTEKEYLDNK